MSIVGIESVVYGVDDLDKSVQFYEEFGLPLTHRDTESAEFTLEEGSRVVLKKRTDKSLPPAWFDGPGVRETFLGVDSDRSMATLTERLKQDRDVRRDPDGTVHFVAEGSLPFAFRLFERKRVQYAPDPQNAPGNIQRLNQHRKWRTRARPKTINHVVFRVENPDASFEFLRDRLGFRLSDISRGIGIFMRADGASEHHNLFVQQAVASVPDLAAGFDHVCFGVEDIDELMAGANYMQRHGWHSEFGVGRHRIASALFYYIDNPCGGRAEYGADTDYLDDSWVPRVWDGMFAYMTWCGRIPPFMNAESPWDVKFVGEYVPGGK